MSSSPRSDITGNPGGDHSPSGRQRGGIGLAVAVAALGGLLFGYDTGVISGAVLFMGDDLQPGGGDLSAGSKQLVVAILLVGAIVGAITGGWLADRLGRKKTLIIVAVIFTLGAVGSALAPNLIMVVVARFVLGVSIGVSSVTVPLYIAEIAPKEKRGALVSMNQLMITVGILLSYVVNKIAEPHWQIMLGFAAVPSILMLVGLFWVDESPRWLTLNDRAQEARSIMMKTRDAEQVELELYQIREDAKAEQRRSWREVFVPSVRPALILGVGVAALNQLVGVNAVIYYAPTMLEPIFGASGSLLATVGIGVVNTLVTVFAVTQIDRLGRRPLLLGGIAVVAVALVALALLYLVPDKSGVVGYLIVGALAVYIAAFAASLGIAIWLVNSEVYPLSVRGKASSLGSFTHWGLDLVIASTVLTLISTITPTGLFGIFAVVAVAGFFFLFRLMPETKGRSLEEINHFLAERAGTKR
ncbi:MAG: sugar porter family MFS transporter [Propionibacteriales bacterium]|nr:sugar porter family MFS transporter [Propionibacteriales bacterium]